MLDKARTSNAVGLLYFGRLLLAMFEDISCCELLHAAPIQLIPLRLIPRRANFGYVPFCKFDRFFRILQQCI